MNDRPAASHARFPALPPVARLTVRLLVVLPLLVLLIASAIYGIALGRLLRANLAPVAAAEAARQLHHDIRLGGVGFGPDVLVLHHVAVSNQKTWAASRGEAALVADQVAIHYSLHDLLFDSGNAGHAIGDVVLENPVGLIVRRPDHQYNFSDLLTRREKKPGKPFVGQILVHNGLLIFRDYVAPARVHERPAVNRLYAVSATVNFHSERYVYFDGVGQGRSERVANVALRGDASRQTAGRYRVFAKVSDGDARYWSDYFKAFPQGRILHGRANLDLTVARLGSKPAPGLPLDLLGRVNFSQVSVALTDPRLSRVPLQEIGGTAIFTGGGVTVDGAGRTAGQPVAVHGTVFDLSRPQLAFTASSDNFDPTPLIRVLPRLKIPAGVGVSPGASVVAQITGASASPVISFDSRDPAITYAGNAARDVYARGVYANDVLSLPIVQFRLAGGGQGLLRATVNTESKISTLLLGGRVTGVNLASLHLPTLSGRKPPVIGGIADASFLTTQGAGGADQPLSVVANVSVARPRFAQTTLRSLRGRVAWAQGHDVTVRRAIVQDTHGGVAVISGQIPTTPRAPWNLAVDAAGADLAALLAPYATVPVAGLAYAQAQVTGSFTTPQVTGQAQVYGGRFGRIGLDSVTGGITADLNGVTLNDVVLRRYPTEARVSGTVTQLTTRNPALALKISLAEGDVQDFLSLAHEVQPARGTKATLPSLPTLTGTAQGTFRVTGRLQSPEVVGHAAVTDATIEAYRFDKIRADLAYRSGVLRVDHGLVLAEGGATATAHGQYDSKNGRIAAAVQGRGLNVDLFQPAFSPYADLNGILDFTADLHGTAHSPQGGLRVSGQALSINGQALAPLTVALRYTDGVLAKTGGPWTFALQPPVTSYDGSPISPQPAPVDYVVDDLRFALPTPINPQRPHYVKLAMHIPAEAPENFAHLIDTARSSRFASTPSLQKALAFVDSLPAPPDGTLFVPSLTVGGTLAAPQVQGTLDARKVTVGDENGVRQAEVVASYVGGAKPSAQASVQITDLRAAGVLLEALAADGSLQNQVVTLRTLDAHTQDADLHAAGHADLNGTLEASLDASNIPLALFNGLIPSGTDGTPRRLSGTLSALTVDASGPTRAPQLIGSLNVDKPVLDLGDRETGTSRYALDSIRTGAVTFTSPHGQMPGQVTVNDLAAFKGGRPVATLSGTVPLNLANLVDPLKRTDLRSPLHAQLKITDLSVLSLLGPSLVDPARTGGMLTASVDAAGGAQSLQGEVNLANASLGLTGFNTALTKVGGRLLLNGDRLTIQGLSAQSNRGGRVSVVGGGTLTQANLQVRADKFVVDEAGKQTFLAQAYNSAARGQLDGMVTVGGPWLSPRIATPSGTSLVVSDASGTLPSVVPPSGRISQVNIVRAGPGTISTARILSVVTEKVGNEFDAARAQSDLNAIRGLGYFNGGVKLSTGHDPTGGVMVTYTVAEKEVETFNPRFDVNVALGGTRNDTVMVRSSLLQAQARGDVNLGGTLLGPTVKAHLTVAKGQFILPPSTLLRIVKPVDGGENIVDARYPGSITSPDEQPGLETRVDLTAQATVSVTPALLQANTSVASPGVAISPSVGQILAQDSSALSNPFGAGSQSQRYKITAHISGLLNVPDRLNLDLQSSPLGLTHQQMLAALVQEDAYLRLARGGAGAEDALKAQLGAAFSTIALPTLLSPLEDSIASTFGLEDFSVDYSPDAPVLVTLSKVIAPRVTATYTRSFGARTPGAVNSVLATPQYTLKLGYGFTKHFQFSVSTDDQRNNTAALEGIYGF